MTGFVFYGMLIYSLRKELLSEYGASGFKYTFAEMVKRKKKANFYTALLILLVALIGISRIYVGVHFPSDVLGGWLLGTMALIVFITIRENLEKKRGRSRGEIRISK